MVANGKTAIAINVDVTCGSITTAATGGSAGGGFTLTSGVTITADIVGGTTRVLTKTATGTAVIIGDLTGGTAAAAYALSVSSGVVTITGNILGGTSTNATAVNISATGGCDITGNVTGGTVNNTWGISSGSSGNTTIVGAVTGGTGGSSQAIGAQLSGTGGLTITGDVTAGTVSQSFGAANTSTGTLIINGDVYATSACSGTTHFVSNANGTTILNGSQVSSDTGRPAIGIGTLLINSSTELTHTYRTDNSGVAGPARSLYTGGTNLGQPVEADVRYATTFGASTEYTGSLRVPDPAYVNAGVLTDATVGTMSASLDATALRTALGMGSANLDTQIATLATPTNITAATGIVLAGVEHTGAIIPTVSTVTDGAKSLTALSTVTWTPTIADILMWL